MKGKGHPIAQRVMDAARLRLVVADLDGTLICAESDLSVAQEAVRRTLATGRAFSIATGRIFASARSWALRLGIRHPIITDGGAVIGCPLSGKRYRHLCIPRAALGQVMCAIAGLGHQIYAFFGDEVYTNRDSEHRRRYEGILQQPIPPDPGLVRRLVDEGRAPTRILLLVDPQEAPALRAHLQARLPRELRVTSSMPHYVDIQHHQASKGWALRQLAELMELTPEQVLAIGDGHYDMEMLEVAGVGALVGNAPAELHPHADMVARNCCAEGVLEILQVLGVGD